MNRLRFYAHFALFFTPITSSTALATILYQKFSSEFRKILQSQFQEIRQLKIPHAHQKQRIYLHFLRKAQHFIQQKSDLRCSPEAHHRTLIKYFKSSYQSIYLHFYYCIHFEFQQAWICCFFFCSQQNSFSSQWIKSCSLAFRGIYIKIYHCHWIQCIFLHPKFFDQNFSPWKLLFLKNLTQPLDWIVVQWNTYLLDSQMLTFWGALMQHSLIKGQQKQIIYLNDIIYLKDNQFITDQALFIQIQLFNYIELESAIIKQWCNKFVTLLIIMQSKQNFGSSFVKDEETILNIRKFMFEQQQHSPILKITQKPRKSFGVNTSRVLVFDKSVELIVPITHLILSDAKSKTVDKVKPKNYQNPLGQDGLDQQICAPFKSSVKDPITNIEHKQSKNFSTHNKIYRSKHKSTWQRQKQPNAIINPQKIQTIKPKISKIQSIVDSNMRNMQLSQNLIKQSRKTIKKINENYDCFGEEKPVTKKSFKISNPHSKLTESKLAKKEEIMNEAKKMVQGFNQANLSRVGKIQKNNLKKKQGDVNLKQEMKQQENSKADSQNQDSRLLIVKIDTSISKIKRYLIQAEEQLQVTFLFPKQLLYKPDLNSNVDELKQKMVSIFRQLGQQPQIVTIKKYQDRVQLRNKSNLIIWGYGGTGYFGGWKGGDQILADSNKHGVGIQWCTRQQGNVEIYYGQFRDNKKQGYGVMKNSQKQLYIGCWKDGQRWGWGKLFDNQGNIGYNGEFIQNRIQTNLTIN